MAPNNKKVKRKKRVDLNVMQKLQLIEKVEQGASVKDVCKIYDVGRSTVIGIRKSKAKLQQYLSTYNIDSSKLDTSVMAPNNKKVKRKKRVDLNVMQKLQLIEKVEQGASVEDVCKIYDVGRSTVIGICKSKAKLQQYLSTYNIDSSKLDTSVIGNKKSMNGGPNTSIDTALYKWYSRQRSRGINVQQSQLKSQLEALRTRMGLNITRKNEWLKRFKTRHGITVLLSDGISSESSASEKKISNEEQVRQEESSNVGNVPSSSISSPIASTRHDISKLNVSTIGKKKCMLHGPNFVLDKALYKWYSLQRSRGINVQQSQLKSQFEALMTRMRLNMKDADSWLWSFKKRYGFISFLSDGICSESSESEKKIINEEQVGPEESIKFGNVPSSSVSSPIASTSHNIPEVSIKAEDLSSPLLPSTGASAHQNISEGSINVENMPSSSFLPPIASTQSKISEDSIKVENSSPESYSSQTDVYHNYVWEEYDIKSEGCPSPLDDKSSDDN